MPLLDDVVQYLSLDQCQMVCEQTTKCTSISWNSRDDRCYLKTNDNACDDVPCDWGYDALDWNFFWKTCGNYLIADALSLYQRQFFQA